MKRILTVAVLAWIIVWASACDDDKPGDKPENLQDMIKKTWRIGATGFVKQDGINVTGEYPNLNVTIKNDGTYTVSNGKKLFYPSGTWKWQGAGVTEVILDDDFSVTVTELTKSTLRIRFMMDASDVNPNGREKAVVGNYELSLEAL